MSAYIVGITGGIATGKTNVTDALKQAGARVVDADEISRHLTREGGAALPAIREAFGDQVFACTDPQHLVLDRQKLGSIVFFDPQKKAQLEQLLHPLIIETCRQALLSAPEKVVFLSAPLLFECSMESMCHEVWCTYIPETLQLSRLMDRDKRGMEDALMRIRSQWSADEKKAKADLVIDTSGTREESARKALDAYHALLERMP